MVTACSIRRAVSMMNACKERIQDIVSNQSFTLHIKGLGHFNEKVMFAKVRLDENEKLLGRIAGWRIIGYRYCII